MCVCTKLMSYNYIYIYIHSLSSLNDALFLLSSNQKGLRRSRKYEQCACSWPPLPQCSSWWAVFKPGGSKDCPWRSAADGCPSHAQSVHFQRHPSTQHATVQIMGHVQQSKPAASTCSNHEGDTGCMLSGPACAHKEGWDVCTSSVHLRKKTAGSMLPRPECTHSRQLRVLTVVFPSNCGGWARGRRRIISRVEVCHPWCHTSLYVGEDLEENEVKWTRVAEMRKAELLVAGKAIVWPNPGSKERSSDSATFPAEGTLIS